MGLDSPTRHWFVSLFELNHEVQTLLNYISFIRYSMQNGYKKLEIPEPIKIVIPSELLFIPYESVKIFGMEEIHFFGYFTDSRNNQGEEVDNIVQYEMNVR